MSFFHLSPALPLLLLMGWSCSGQTSVLRTSGSETSSDSTTFQAKPGNRPIDDGEGASGYTDANVPIPINGMNVVEVSASNYCESPCTRVRLAGTIIVDGKPYLLNSNTQRRLAINFAWTIPDQPTATFNANGFNPRGISKEGSSLADTIFNSISLTIVTSNGRTVSGSLPSTPPIPAGAIQGNFMLFEAAQGFAPSGIRHPKASAPFNQIWAVLKSDESHLPSLKDVSYVTNILYNGEGTSNWHDLDDLCRNKIDSADWPRQGWRLGTIVELCDPFEDPPPMRRCKGGLQAHRIREASFAGGNWDGSPFWSSTIDPGVSYEAFEVAGLGALGYVGRGRASSFGSKAICVR